MKRTTLKACLLSLIPCEMKIDETKKQIIDIEIELKTEFPQEKQYQELIKKQSDLNLKIQFENDLTETTENPSKKCVPKDNTYEMEI